MDRIARRYVLFPLALRSQPDGHPALLFAVVVAASLLDGISYMSAVHRTRRNVLFHRIDCVGLFLRL
jgi:hypothetical protein